MITIDERKQSWKCFPGAAGLGVSQPRGPRALRSSVRAPGADPGNPPKVDKYLLPVFLIDRPPGRYPSGVRPPQH